MSDVGVGLLRVWAGFVLLISVLPAVPLGFWAVRLWDFPRLQIASGAILSVGIVFAVSRYSWYQEHSRPAEAWVLLALFGGVAVWQLSHVVQYLPGFPMEVSDADSESQHCRVAVVNLQYENQRKDEVIHQLAALDVDLLLLIELDAAWDAALAEVRGQFAYHIGEVREEGLGLMLWSHLPLEEATVQHLVSEDRASIHCNVLLADDQKVKFVGVHPTPPGLYNQDAQERFDSRIRDAELMLIAKDVAQAPDNLWVVTGDFNDVAWSHTTRLFKRISGLKDPRVGRGLYNSYHADYPLMRFPIDQVFVSASAKIHSLGRFHPPGSDHFGIITDLSFGNADRVDASQPRPAGDDIEDAHELIREGHSDANDADVES